MDLMTIAILGIALLVLLLFLGMNIGLAMAFVGFAGYWYVRDFGAAFGILKTIPFTNAMKYSFMVIPMFVLMGQFAFHANLSSGLFHAADRWLGRFRGGLAMATVAACAGFSAICGSTAATAATMGTVALPEMRRHGYQDSLATGSIAAGGTLGILIPPCTGFFIYGIVAEQSIGQLFAAGILPGIVLALCYIAAIGITVRVKPALAPQTVKYSLREMLVSLKGIVAIAVLFLAVIGGMFMGYFTANEAAAIGAMLALLYMILMRQFTWARFLASLRDTIKTSAMVFLILVGAYIFGAFLAITQLPMRLAAFVEGLDVNRYVVLAIIIAIYIVLGCLMDSLAMVMLTVPIFLPIIISLGFDPIWYGVLMIMVMEMGLITPPVGMNVYIVAGVAKDVPLTTIFRGVAPMVIGMVVAIIAVVCVPQLALFLPGQMSGI
ncbi:MAG: TRAP transporter large permease [Clostridiales Family XIII bacterium]|nr:TRAP transporter large permease [Clostridiales Family XIII bacterium]